MTASRGAARPRGGWEKHVLRSIDRALARESKLSRAALQASGMSSPTIRRFLNDVCAFPGVRYLEVGSWRGASLVCASYRNRGRFVGIENFSLPGCSAYALARTLRRFAPRSRAEFRAADCWTLDMRTLGGPFNVYYYDGFHGYDHQYRAFVHYDGVLAPTFVALVDDWNLRAARAGTRDAFRDLGYEVVMERELATRGLQFPQDLWWNGFFVAVVRRRHRTAAVTPPRARGGLGGA